MYQIELILVIYSNIASLIDIKSLEKWNTSKGINFSGIISGCSSLLDIKPLETWKLLNKNFKYKHY